MKSLTHILRINISIDLLLVLTLIGITTTALYFCLPSMRENLIFLGSVFVFLTGIYSAFFVGKSLRINVNHNKIKGSFEFMSRFSDISLEKLRTESMQKVDIDNITPHELNKIFTADKELNTTLKTTLNLFEEISIAIQVGYVDEFVMYKLLYESAMYYNKYFNKFIEYSKEKYKFQTIYCEYQKLVRAWESGKTLQTNEEIKLNT